MNGWFLAWGMAGAVLLGVCFWPPSSSNRAIAADIFSGNSERTEIRNESDGPIAIRRVDASGTASSDFFVLAPGGSFFPFAGVHLRVVGATKPGEIVVKDH